MHGSGLTLLSQNKTVIRINEDFSTVQSIVILPTHTLLADDGALGDNSNTNGSKRPWIQPEVFLKYLSSRRREIDSLIIAQSTKSTSAKTISKIMVTDLMLQEWHYMSASEKVKYVEVPSSNHLDQQQSNSRTGHDTKRSNSNNNRDLLVAHGIPNYPTARHDPVPLIACDNPNPITHNNPTVPVEALQTSCIRWVKVSHLGQQRIGSVSQLLQ